MNRKNLLIIVIAFALMGLNAKGQVTFQKTYGGDSSDIGACVKQAPDGGYAIVGWTKNYGISGIYNVYLIRTNANGDTLFTKTYGRTRAGVGSFIALTSDGGFIIAGQSTNTNGDQTLGYLIKTDSLGNILFDKTLNGLNQANYNIEFTSIIQTSDSGYAMTGYETFGPANMRSILIKMDTIGNMDATVSGQFGNNYNSQGNSIQQTSDGGYVIGGWLQNQPFNPSNNLFYLIRTDHSGSPIFKKTYGEIGFTSMGISVQQTNDGGFLFGGGIIDSITNIGHLCLIKTDTIGNIVWTKTYGGALGEGSGYINKTNDGGFIIVSKTFSFGAGGTDVYLIKININGDTLWTKTYGGTGDDNGSYVQQTTDGGYIICGTTNSFGAASNDIYIIKTDSLGNSGCHQGNTATITTIQSLQIVDSTTVGGNGMNFLFTSVSSTIGNGGIVNSLCFSAGINEVNQTTPSLLLSPNPFTTTTTLTLQGTYHNPSLYIYNLLGQVVETQNFVPLQGTSLPNQQITIQRNQLPAGMYFYKLIDENKEVIGIGKMVVE